MRRNIRLLVLFVALGGLAAPASPQNPPSFEAPAARVSRGAAGSPLTLPSTASPAAVLAQYLREQGRSEATVQSLVEASRAPGRGGIRNARFEQRAAGLPVYGTYAKAAFSSQGELLNLVENLVDTGRAVGRARINEQQAVAAAIAFLYPALRTVPAGFFRNAPTATRVAIPGAEGTIDAGFLVQTWTQRTNELNETLVDGAGAVRHVEARTNNDRYNVFRINPDVTRQAIVSGAGSGNAESPSGWLFSRVQGSTNIAGNNANAYLDAVSNNRSDADGVAVDNGEFLTVANLATSPTTAQNREVAVQNLFYLNNLIHDVLYRHGFVEAAGNFQEHNFANGGRGSDSVNAEAQDGGGTDNANFATPRDGQNPRMQMYLWDGFGTHQVLAGGQTFLAQGAVFGPAMDAAGISSTIRLANDNTGTATDACEPVQPLTGAIALVDRGTCDFVVKVKNAQNAGALAVIVANNRDGDAIQTMGGADRSITIPSVFVSQNSGTTLKAMVPVSGIVRLSDPAPLSRDGDVDADIVFHEYCHGLTWRMIGRMDGPLAGAVGEGMSDVCAILMNSADREGGDVIGEYSASDARGIRRAPYSNYPNTYADVAGASVHNDGEIYAAIGYRLLQLFGAARKDALFGYMVDGMNYTPPQPTYEQMRDGILTAVALSPDGRSGDECLVWNGFATFGVGVGAKATVRGRSVLITESTALPAGCAVKP
jgi:extracellular elastinolytic metalloproteinase